MLNYIEKIGYHHIPSILQQQPRYPCIKICNHLLTSDTSSYYKNFPCEKSFALYKEKYFQRN